MGKKNKNINNLGKSLINDRFSVGKQKKGQKDHLNIHTSVLNDGYDWGRLNLQSVTEESSFQEFLSIAELAGNEFEAEKLNVKFVNQKSCNIPNKNLSEIENKHKEMLKIPRRPHWNSNTTSVELEAKEREIFLEWRRKLAVLQDVEGYLLTPYEKNLEFWRQLWRVIERSDIILQILDARNPLMFYCKDLEIYVKEVNKNKENVVLLNKADFLNEKQRRAWADYFTVEKIKIIFYSAATSLSDSLKKNTSEEVLDEFNLSSNKEIKNSSRIFSSTDLIKFFRMYHQAQRVIENKTVVGLVGYPNVGKSSTLNSLLTFKKAAVSATPGKTKHFQTFNVTEDLILCDSPGLVMPNFVSTKSDMIINGILPIDQMRDHVPPITLITSLMPRNVLEDTYSIMLPKPLEWEDSNRNPTFEELLNAFGFSRGYMTKNGQPDHPRSARYIIKDFVSGKLLYCFAPPGFDQKLYQIFPKTVKERNIDHAPANYIRAVKSDKISSDEIDKAFFRHNQAQVHIKGVRKIFSTLKLSDVDAKALVESHLPGKPWKQINKHVNKKKKEKLRRVYAELDRH